MDRTKNFAGRLKWAGTGYVLWAASAAALATTFFPIPRTVYFAGTQLPPNASNAVVTLDGHPLPVLSSSPTAIAAALPDWVSDGIHAIRIGHDAAVGELIKFRTPGLPAPQIAPPARPADASSVTLSWQAQLRGLYSVHGSTDLLHWFPLTNGIPGTALELRTTLTPAKVLGSPLFLRVYEEPGVLD